MGQFRKKPVVIEATQWFKNGDHPEDHCVPMDGYFPETLSEGEVVRYFRTPDLDDGESVCKRCKECLMKEHGWIDTLEGGHIVCPGDWIITGVQGERYPCKDAIFQLTYEPAGDDEQVETRAFITEMPPPVHVPGIVAKDPCDIAPEGWWCSRKSGHEGPCAAWPDGSGPEDAQVTTVPHWVAMVLYSALDDIDTADDLAKGDEGLYRNLVRRYNQERHKVAECDGYTVKFHAMDEQPEEVEVLRDVSGVADFIANPHYVRRLHNLVASMVEALHKENPAALTAFDQAWLSTFDDPDSFPEVTKIVNADKS